MNRVTVALIFPWKLQNKRAPISLAIMNQINEDERERDRKEGERERAKKGEIKPKHKNVTCTWKKERC